MPLWLILLLILYFLFPYDLVPDFFPGVGWVDDILLIGLLGYFFFLRPRRAERSQRGEERASGNRAFREEDEAVGKRRPRPFNPYEVLGVKETASSDEIKTAYRRLVSRYHPDKVTHLGEEFRVLAEKKFKEIQRAYQDLRVK